MISIAKEHPENSHASMTAAPTPRGEEPTQVSDNSPVAKADPCSHADGHAAPTSGAPHLTPSHAPVTTAVHRHRKWFLLAGIAIAITVGGHFVAPLVETALNTVSTDDAYVNGHVTYVAPRVSGTVIKVLVDDNQRVKKGDVLLQLDPEPYQVQVNIAQAAVNAADAELIAARAQVSGSEVQVRSYQFNMQHAIEDVHNKTAELRGTIAKLETAEAKQARATADYQRAGGAKSRARCN